MTASEGERPRRPPPQLAWSIAIAFIAVVGISGAGVAYTNYVQKQAERRAEVARQESDWRWCALLTDLDAAYQTAPGPATELGKQVAAELHRLRVGFGCPER